MKEPVYEFQFESKFLPKFEKYPRDEPAFNWLTFNLSLFKSIYVLDF
jgi:hypothetical protein